MKLRSSLLAALILLVLQTQSHAADPPHPMVVAHRGLLRHAPENTLANFRACLELRIGFEFDVERSRDGHLVCLHDSTVDRTTNGKGYVTEMTLEQIRKLDAGSWFDSKFAGEKVPTVEEVLELVAQHQQHEVLIAVDLKGNNSGREVVQLAEKHKVLHRLLFIGLTISDSNVRDNIRNTSAKAHTAVVANNSQEFPAAMAAANADWVYVRYLPSKLEVEAIHAQKRRVFIAGTTVGGNLPENWRHATRVGIDGILTDFPLELRTALREIK